MKLKVTRIAVYLYRRTGTLSFCWVTRWTWIPRMDRREKTWWIRWGCCCLEWFGFEDDDPFGDEQAKRTAEMLELLAEFEDK